MRYKSTLLVVRDMERSKRFYKEVFGLRVTLDFGANVTLTGGINLQTRESWARFLDTTEDAISFGGKDAELYFEEADFDMFLAKLASLECIEYVHPVKEHDWGQRAVRIYDPDGHVLEIGEPIEDVCRRFHAQGMHEEAIARRMDIPVMIVRKALR